VTKIRALEVDDVRLRIMSQSQLKGYLGGREGLDIIMLAL
jgi:hypothetical protein